MNRIHLPSLFYTVFLGGAVIAEAGPIAYTQDTNLHDFLKGVTNYAQFQKNDGGDVAAFGGFPYTPTASTLLQGYRVVGHDLNIIGLNPIVVQFLSGPVSQIEVFANIDHVGTRWDAYQYSIYGSNDGITFVPLFNATAVNEPSVSTGIDQNFTLKTWTGTAPTLVNNALTLGDEAAFGTFGPGRGPAGYVGYEAFFSFSNSYQYYLFGTSTVTKLDMVVGSDQEVELSAVAQAAPVPEPKTWATILAGFGVIGLRIRRISNKSRSSYGGSGCP